MDGHVGSTPLSGHLKYKNIIIYDKKISCLHLNPGAAGKQGWQKVRTLLRFSISVKKIHNLDLKR